MNTMAAALGKLSPPQWLAAMSHLTPDEHVALAKHRHEVDRQSAAKVTPPPSLHAFFNATSPWPLEDWQIRIADRLEKLTWQKGQRLLIHGPPQHGKSILVSNRFPAYALGVRPDLRIRLACYNMGHAVRFSKDVLSVMRGPDFQKMFPSPAVRVPTLCSAQEWSTPARSVFNDANPSFAAVGLGGGLIGMGGDLFIIDDPYKNPEEARSIKVNDNIWDWHNRALMTRINADTNIVVMFHRWQVDDYAGKLIEQGGWEYLRFAAIGDGDEDPMGRPVGQSLSVRYPTAALRKVEAQDPLSFQGLYQG
jgi:hypothetical protein